MEEYNIIKHALECGVEPEDFFKNLLATVTVVMIGNDHKEIKSVYETPWGELTLEVKLTKEEA